MKTLRKLAMIVFIPLIGGFALLIIGSVTGNETLVDVGISTLTIGIPVVMFALVVLGLVLMITGKIDLSDHRRDTTPDNDDSDDESDEDDEESNDSDNDDTMTESEREQEEIDEVNSSRGYDSHLRQSEYIARHTANNYKNSTTKEKVLGWLFFGFLMTDFALILVFAFLGIGVGTLVCFCIFGGTILISLIVVKTVERLSLRGSKHVPDDAQAVRGRVKACLLSSTTSVGGSRRYSTTRITDVTYRVILEHEGTDYSAYSKEFYDQGSYVSFYIIGKRRASIADSVDLNEKSSGDVDKYNVFDE